MIFVNQFSSSVRQVIFPLSFENSAVFPKLKNSLLFLFILIYLLEGVGSIAVSLVVFKLALVSVAVHVRVSSWDFL